MVIAALIVVAFLAPGSWAVYTLPQVPIAQLSYVLAVAIWLGVFGFKFVRPAKVSKNILIALGCLLATVVISIAANPYVFQTIFYDVYGEMPAILWLCYAVIFILAAMTTFSKDVLKGLQVVFMLGVAITVIAAVYRWTSGFVTVFGSPAYATPALGPLVILGVALGSLQKKHAIWYYLAAAVMAVGLLYATSGILAGTTLIFSVMIALALYPRIFRVPARAERAVRIVGIALVGITMLATAVVQIPALRQHVLSTDKAATMEQSVATRVLLWDGAQKMFAEKPLFGYGPGGYRMNAIKYYDERIFPFVANLGADPIAYSSPSPHSLFWDLLLRLGVVGLLVHIALLVLWGLEVRRRFKQDEGSDTVRMLRMVAAVIFLSYLFSLLFTPVYFATSLFGVVAAGLAIAPNSKVREDIKAYAAFRIACIVGMVALVAFGTWRAVGLSKTQVDARQSMENNAAQIEDAARILPGEPLNERHRLEMKLALATSEADLKAAQKAIDDAPGYITDYGPNLAQFAMISLDQAKAAGRKDLTWEKDMLKRAGDGYPTYPLLSQELEHLKEVEAQE